MAKIEHGFGQASGPICANHRERRRSAIICNINAPDVVFDLLEA